MGRTHEHESSVSPRVFWTLTLTLALLIGGALGHVVTLVNFCARDLSLDRCVRVALFLN